MLLTRIEGLKKFKIALNSSKNRTWKYICLSLFLLLLAVSVSPIQAEEAGSVSLTSPKSTLNVGEYVLMKAAVSGTGTSQITWKSLNSAVATVSQSGLVIARKAGKATIVASSGSASGRYTLTVKHVVKMSKSSVSLEVGRSLALTATVFGKTGEVTWKSLNSPVATVSSSGVVTAKKTGTAAIIANDNGVTARCLVTVTEPILTMSKTSLSLMAGNTSALTVKKNGKTVTASWKSLNKAVATVTPSGQVKAIKAGQAAIIATVGTNTARCLVTVKEKSMKEKALDAFRVFLEEKSSHYTRFEVLYLPRHTLPVLFLGDFNEISMFARNMSVVYYDPGSTEAGKDISYFSDDLRYFFTIVSDVQNFDDGTCFKTFLKENGYSWETWSMKAANGTTTVYRRWWRGSAQRCFKGAIPISISEYRQAVDSRGPNTEYKAEPYVWNEYCYYPDFPLLKNTAKNRATFVK